MSYSSLSTPGGGLTTSKASRCICNSICTTHGFPFCLWTFASWVAIWKESSFMIRDRFGSEKKCNGIKYYLLVGSTLILSKINVLGWHKWHCQQRLLWGNTIVIRNASFWSLNVNPLLNSFLLKVIFLGLQLHMISSSWLMAFTNNYWL